MSNWMKRCPTWQLALAWGGLMAVADVVSAAASQWMSHGHLNFSALVGWAAGAMLVSPIAALGYRTIKSQDR
ncbi:MAG TPA: hypothetical protein VFV41_26005 [Streptosporangiaceae bacterium]|nr:hypothetical protein [Streptosporangiaceae bacterium]